MSQSNKMSVMQLTILTAVNMMRFLSYPGWLPQWAPCAWLMYLPNAACTVKKAAAWAAMRNILLEKPVTSWLITPTAFLWFSQILRSPFLL